MWRIPLPNGMLTPDAPFLVPVPGLGPVLIVVAFLVLAGLGWLIAAELARRATRPGSVPRALGTGSERHHHRLAA